MKISTLSKSLLILLALSACSSSDEVSSDDTDAKADTVDNGDAGVSDNELLSEVSGQSASKDFSDADLDGGDGVGPKKEAKNDTADMDNMGGELDSMEAGNSPAPAAEKVAADEPATLDQAPTEEVAEAPAHHRASASNSGEEKMVHFYDGSETGANVVGIDWQQGYGDNAIKFPCKFNKRSPLKESEDRFGCVIKENEINTVIHVHEAITGDEAVLSKVTIDMKGKEAEQRWENDLQAAGYAYHKDFPWHNGLTAKRYISGDQTTHAFIVYNAPEDAATLIFTATAKGLGKDLQPVASNDK